MTRQRKFPTWLFPVRAEEVCVCYLGNLEEGSCQPMIQGHLSGWHDLAGCAPQGTARNIPHCGHQTCLLIQKQNHCQQEHHEMVGQPQRRLTHQALTLHKQDVLTLSVSTPESPVGTTG